MTELLRVICLFACFVLILLSAGNISVFLISTLVGQWKVLKELWNE